MRCFVHSSCDCSTLNWTSNMSNCLNFKFSSVTRKTCTCGLLWSDLQLCRKAGVKDVFFVCVCVHLLLCTIYLIAVWCDSSSTIDCWVCSCLFHSSASSFRLVARPKVSHGNQFPRCVHLSCHFQVNRLVSCKIPSRSLRVQTRCFVHCQAVRAKKLDGCTSFRLNILQFPVWKTTSVENRRNTQTLFFPKWKQGFTSM